MEALALVEEWKQDGVSEFLTLREAWKLTGGFAGNKQVWSRSTTRAEVAMTFVSKGGTVGAYKLLKAGQEALGETFFRRLMVH